MELWRECKQVYDAARTLFPAIILITANMMDRVPSLLDGNVRLMARDALASSLRRTEL